MGWTCRVPQVPVSTPIHYLVGREPFLPGWKLPVDRRFFRFCLIQVVDATLFGQPGWHNQGNQHTNHCRTYPASRNTSLLLLSSRPLAGANALCTKLHTAFQTQPAATKPALIIRCLFELCFMNCEPFFVSLKPQHRSE